MNKLIFTFACLIVSTTTHADTKDELVRKYFEAANFKKSHELSMEAIYQRAAAAPAGVAEDEKPAYEKARKRMNEIYRDKLSWEAIEPACSRIHKVRFTEEELKAMVDFYESPIGKSIAAKSPEISRLCSQVTVTEIRKVMPIYQQYLTEELTAVYSKRPIAPAPVAK